MQISHMFYADDAVFVGQWSYSNIDTIVHVLDCFYRASSLHINMSKSKLMGISVDEEKVDQATSKIGCATLKAPFSYLGSKVGGLMSRIQSWKEIVDSMVMCHSKWKMKTLSIGGRLTLLNEAGLCGKKLIWVKWNNVLVSKEKGGLGVSSLYALNRDLMFKWIWRFITQSSSLWTRVVKAIHGDDGKIGKNSKSAYPSIWLDIVHEMSYSRSKVSMFIVIFKKKLEMVRIQLFGRMFGETMLRLNIDLLINVEGVSLVNMNDRWVWYLEGSGEFFVTSVRKLIDDKRLPEVSSKTRWIKAVPIKVNIHAWKVRFPPYPFNYPERRLTMKEMLAKFIDEGKREHVEIEIFIKEFRTTNELLLKERSNLLRELKIKGGKMMSEATRSKEINETGINKNEPLRFEQDVQEKPHDVGVKNKSLSIPERTTQPLETP
ncbi:hypothetical protein Tco_0014657 [Tanacetum coccineum]